MSVKGSECQVSELVNSDTCPRPTTQGRHGIHSNIDKAMHAGNQHDWNRLEILAQGNRIRVVCNGTQIVDWRDSPSTLQSLSHRPV